MKPTLNEEIEMSAKGIDYVNSLEEKQYTDIWNKNPQSAETVFTKQQLIDLGISNNIPKTAKRFKIINAFEKFLFAVFAMGVIFYVCLFLYWINH